MGHEKVDLYGTTYSHFAASIYAEIRADAFGEDIGQTSWLTVDEHDLFLSWLELDRGSRLLDVACGSGGPSLRAAQFAQCHVLGIDVHEQAIRTAQRQAGQAGLAGQVEFRQVDASKSLPFPDGTFDAVICLDAINHLPDRAGTLREWARILKPAGRAVFTNPIVVTGPLSNSEIQLRSSVGFFLFVPPGFDERLLMETGFRLIQKEDRTENMARISSRWCTAREAHAADLRRLEGDETFEGQQRFLDVAARLASERRLSRFAFCAQRGG